MGMTVRRLPALGPQAEGLCKASDGELGAQQRGISNNNQQNQPVKLVSSNQTRMFNNHMIQVI